MVVGLMTRCWRLRLCLVRFGVLRGCSGKLVGASVGRGCSLVVVERVVRGFGGRPCCLGMVGRRSCRDGLGGLESMRGAYGVMVWAGCRW